MDYLYCSTLHPTQSCYLGNRQFPLVSTLSSLIRNTISQIMKMLDLWKDNTVRTSDKDKTCSWQTTSMPPTAKSLNKPFKHWNQGHKMYDSCSIVIIQWQNHTMANIANRVNNHKWLKWFLHREVGNIIQIFHCFEGNIPECLSRGSRESPRCYISRRRRRREI